MNDENTKHFWVDIEVDENIIDYENRINANKYRLRALEQLAQLKNAQLGVSK